MERAAAHLPCQGKRLKIKRLTYVDWGALEMHVNHTYSFVIWDLFDEDLVILHCILYTYRLCAVTKAWRTIKPIKKRPKPFHTLKKNVQSLDYMFMKKFHVFVNSMCYFVIVGDILF